MTIFVPPDVEAWSLACPDWEARLREGRPLVPQLPLNKTRADLAVAIFDKLQLPDVPGTPRLADACGEWFREIIRAIYGSWFPERQVRMIREVFALVPKKNSKTTYGAALMLVALLMNERPNANFHLLAPTQDITDIAFSQIAGMVRLNPDLARRLRVQDHIKTITHRASGSTLEVMSFDPRVVTGLLSAGWLLDELHEAAKMSKADSALRQLRGGRVAIPETFGVIISTQSETAPTGIFKTELAKARAVRDGLSRSPTLPIIYEFPPDIAESRDAWRDPQVWRLVLPNIGRSVTISGLMELMADELVAGEDKLKLWATQYLNLQMGGLNANDNWAGAQVWPAAVEFGLDLDELLDRCEVACIGADGGGLDDLFGVAVIGREKGTRRWLAWCKAWCNIVALQRRKGNAAIYIDLAKAGELVVVDADGPIPPDLIASRLEEEGVAPRAPKRDRAGQNELPPAPADLAGIVAVIKRVEAAGILAEIGLDKAGIGGLVDALALEGIANEEGMPDRIVAVPQGFMLMGAIKTVERKLDDGTLLHADQQLMDWAVGNAKIEMKANYVMITKALSGAAKIDPLMALFDAAALMARDPVPLGGPSVYNSERQRPGGFLVV